MFIFERLCSIVYPEETETGEFYLSLEKDPQQEEFLQVGRNSLTVQKLFFLTVIYFYYVSVLLLQNYSTACMPKGIQPALNNLSHFLKKISKASKRV